MSTPRGLFINRLQHASQSSPEGVQKEQSDLEELKQQYKNQKQAAQGSHTYYTTLINDALSSGLK